MSKPTKVILVIVVAIIIGWAAGRWVGSNVTIGSSAEGGVTAYRVGLAR